MVLRFFLFAVIFLFAACTEMGERSNPDDPNGINFRGGLISNTSSQSVGEASSSSVATGASSSSVAAGASSSSVAAGASSSSVTAGASSSSIKSAVVGTQTWMTENLNYDVPGSVCYNKDPLNCNKYGRLYTWAAAMNLPDSCNIKACYTQISDKHKGICPSGWHIPSNQELSKLASFNGLELVATDGWNLQPGKAQDPYGLCILPAGRAGISSDDGTMIFSSIGQETFWWSKSENNAEDKYQFSQMLGFYATYLAVGTNLIDNGKGSYLSVRCIKD